VSSFKFFWTTHKWVGIIAAIFFATVAVTGFMLLIKKKVDWIQPPSAEGPAPGELHLSLEEILEAVRTMPDVNLQSWDDIDRLDVRPDKGIVKVRGNNRWEVQVDTATGEVLHVAYRRSDLIESIHDGSLFADWIHEWVMPAVSVSLIFMIFSGVYLWLEPKWRRAKRRKRKAAATHRNPT